MEATLIYNTHARSTSKISVDQILAALHAIGYDPILISTSSEEELDRALELFKELAFEKKMEQTTEKLEELAQKQDKLAEDAAKQDKKDQAGQEKLQQEQNRLSEEFKQVEEDIKSLQKDNKELEQPSDMPDTKGDQESI